MDFTPLRVSAHAAEQIAALLSPGAADVATPILAPGLSASILRRCTIILSRNTHTLGAMHRDSEDVINIDLLDERGRRRLFRVAFDADDRIRLLSFARETPPGVEIRPVRAEELPQLALLEAACPIELGGGDYDRIYRPNIADQLALQGDNVQWAAWRGDTPIAFRGVAFKTVPVNGADQHVCLSQFSLTHPDERGANLMQCITRFEDEHPKVMRAEFVAHMDEGNAQAEAAYGGEQSKRINWTRRVKQLTFACAPDPPGFGRAASDADLPRVAALLNHAHAGRTFYALQSAASLAERLARAPHAYSAASFQITDRAAIGLWLSGEDFEEARGGVVRRRRPATVVDYGYDGAAGLDDLGALIDTARRRAAAAGMTHLVLYVGEGAPELDAIAPRASAIDSFILRSPMPEPPAHVIAYADALFI